MGQPIAERSPETIGHHGALMFFARWTTTDESDYVNYRVLRRSDLSGDYTNARFSIHEIEWTTTPGISFLLYFDSIPQGGKNDVWQAAAGSSGRVCFSETVPGSRTDSNRVTPGELIMQTFGASAGEQISMKIKYTEKGVRKP